MSTDAWDMVPLALVAQVTLGKMVQNSTTELETVEQPYLHAANVRDFGVLDTDHSHRTMWFSPGEVDSLKVKSGDVVVVEGGAVGKSAYVKNDLPGYGFQNSILRVRAKKRVSDGRFIQYSLQSAYDSGEISRQCSSVSLAHFPAEKINRFRIPCPSLETQQRIADYLDRETAEIDAAVADLDRYLDLLNAKLDSTGREIFATLSEEWQLIQTKFLVDITTGSGDTQDAKEDGEFPFYVRSDTIQRSDDHEFDCDAVLTSGDGAGVGKIFHLASGKFKAHQRVYVMHNFRRVSPEYFYWMFKSAFPDVIRYGGAKSTVDSVRMPMIANLKLPVPDKSTQEEISGRLASLYEEVDSLIAESTKLRDLLLKRRSVLITEVVTGRKQV
jgi:hypothetical protein